MVHKPGPLRLTTIPEIPEGKVDSIGWRTGEADKQTDTETAFVNNSG